jgi:hypothetical protein
MLTGLLHVDPDLLIIPNQIEPGGGTIALLIHMAHGLELEARI